MCIRDSNVAFTLPLCPDQEDVIDEPQYDDETFNNVTFVATDSDPITEDKSLADENIGANPQHDDEIFNDATFMATDSDPITEDKSLADENIGANDYSNEDGTSSYATTLKIQKKKKKRDPCLSTGEKIAEGIQGRQRLVS